jgi:hypothetical protein
MQNKTRQIEKLIISFLVLYVFIAISMYPATIIPYTLDELLANNDKGRTYNILIVIKLLLNQTKVLLNIAIAFFLYTYSPSKKSRLTWVPIGLLFGFEGLILFILNQIFYFRFEDKTINNTVNSLSLYSWTIISTLLLLIIYICGNFVINYELSNNIELYFIVVARLPGLAVAIWTWKISPLVKANKWLWSVFAFMTDLISPIILIIITILNKENLSKTTESLRNLEEDIFSEK